MSEGGPRADRRGRRSRRPGRPFTLLDSMVAVGFAAVAALGWKQLGEHFSPNVAHYWLGFLHKYSNFLMVLSSAFLLAVRLVRPRPSLRRVARQPGFAACSSILIYAFLFNAPPIVASMVLEGIYDLPFWNRWLIFRALDAQTSSWIAVGIAWTILAVGRLGRAEPNWVDRAGRVVGWFAILWGLASFFFNVESENF